MRVIILEDDAWIADLLRQIVHSLRPQAQISCQVSVSAALAEWQRQSADLVICDWNLPDGPGTRLLEQIRKQDSQIPLVMITGRADRDSVLEVRSLRINAFISKPFQMPKVLDCLNRLLPSADLSFPASSSLASNFSEFLSSQAADELDMPLQAGTLDKLRALGRQPADLRQLHNLGRDEPAITARLLAAANSAQYSSGGEVCLSLTQALQTLGAGTSLNIALGLALNPAAELEDAELQLQAMAAYEQIQVLCQRLAELAAACRLDPAPLHSAALLHRMGELCVLQQAQRWRNSGHTLSLEELSQALSGASSEVAARLKIHWRLPNPLRELIGACYALPTINTKREAIVMHLAASELGPQPDSAKLARLRRLAGLS
ncbi:HDOD domain-containing protein [Aquipseudomonas guryensis]|jgi:HD-like signal output (HDOD) protein/ActR/RegA family two-component response regulator|uniref:HDOD domain-containing protein n=1 Tax=Aquipseudomonas guryensis TaxID=2759165 RepID=A0A7W4DFD7_9GAMM|nr:HDOD domain-containing protein [Pseudomonas guryensis]MBB1521466.1 HDOD domain-containing protein [Pseudomonas guryensis]